MRRDFTINGLFYDPIAKKVLDFVGGQKDIERKRIRFIGEAHERIKEDHLRLLRAIRFKNNFSFDYAASTKKAIQDLHHLVEGLSAERVQSELTKMLLHSHRSHSMKELMEFGLLAKILPEVEACRHVRQPVEYHQEGDVFTHLLKSLHDLPDEWVSKTLVWAVLFHDIGKPDTFEEREDRIHFDGHAELSAQMAEKIMRRLKFSKAEMVKIKWMVDKHMSIGFIESMRRAHQVDLFLNPWFEELMKLHHADEHGSLPIDLSMYERIMKLYHEFKDEKLLEDHFKPLLNGNEIMELLKIKPGPQIQTLLKALREAQIEGEVMNKEAAVTFVKNSKGLF